MNLNVRKHIEEKEEEGIEEKKREKRREEERRWGEEGKRGEERRGERKRKTFEFIEHWKATFPLKGLFCVFRHISLYKNQIK